MKRAIESILHEYLAGGEVIEVGEAIRELHAPHYHNDVVTKVILLAMNMRSVEREATSFLLAELCSGGIISHDHFTEGFIRSFRNLPDMILDTPDAPEVLGTFAARAIADGVLSPTFIETLPAYLTDGQENTLATLSNRSITRILELFPSHARERASAENEETPEISHFVISRLARVWGIGDGRPVGEIKLAVENIVREYIQNEDRDSARQEIVNLEATFFMHELVKRVIFVALEQEKIRLALTLLVYLSQVGDLPLWQTRKGVIRAIIGVEDLSLDVPGAIEQFISLFHSILDEELVQIDILEDDSVKATISAELRDRLRERP